MKNKAFKIIKMVTCSTQHREVWMQSKDTILLLIFAREDSRYVRVFSAKNKLHFWSVHAMGARARTKAHWFRCAGSTTHSLKGSTHSKLGNFQISTKGSTSLRARAAISFPSAWSPRQLPSLLMIRPVMHRNRRKEVDILTNPLDLICSDIDRAVLC